MLTHIPVLKELSRCWIQGFLYPATELVAFTLPEEQNAGALLSLHFSQCWPFLTAPVAEGEKGSTLTLTPENWRYSWCLFSQSPVSLHLYLWKGNKVKGGTQHGTAICLHSQEYSSEPCFLMATGTQIDPGISQWKLRAPGSPSPLS